MKNLTRFLRNCLGAMSATVFVLSASAASADTITIPFDNNFEGHKISWSGFVPGETIILYKVVNIDGKAAVCGGFYIEGPGSISTASRKSMRATGVFAGNLRIMTSIGHFNRIDPDAPAESLEFRCRVGNVAWRSTFDNINTELRSRHGRIEL